jgi:hypothetical protein
MTKSRRLLLDPQQLANYFTRSAVLWAFRRTNHRVVSSFLSHGRASWDAARDAKPRKRRDFHHLKDGLYAAKPRKRHDFRHLKDG